MVETQVEYAADFTCELEEGYPFRYGENTIRVPPDLPLAVTLDDPEQEDPFPGLCLAPVHRDLMIRVRCTPHSQKIVRDSISGCLLRCKSKGGRQPGGSRPLDPGGTNVSVINSCPA